MRPLAAIALGVLLAALARPDFAGTLRVEADSPLGPLSVAVRVLEKDGRIAAVVRLGEPTAIAPGTYRVELLIDPPVVRAAVVVGTEGEAVVRFTEIGALRLEVVAADGTPLVTAADVFLADGRRVASIGTGEGETLAAGTYRVLLRTNPNRSFDKVVVRPGQIEKLRLKMSATLALEAKGPPGVAVALHARLRHPDGSDLVIASGESIELPPGAYTVVVDSIPPLRREVTLEAARRTAVTVSDLGALAFDLRDGDGGLVEAAVTLIDPRSDLVLATARNGEVLAARAGTYRIRFEAGARGSAAVVRDRIRVVAARTTRVGRAAPAVKKNG
jgi:hypothetical protein